MRTEITKTNILTTKLHRPPLPADYVPRDQLLQKLKKYHQCPLTFISAPAGYGKSTLARSWIDVHDLPTGWISLDERDNTLPQFLHYFVQALCEIFPDSFKAILDRIKVNRLQNVVEDLINEIEDLDQQFVMVLDDYHMITVQEIHTFIENILRHPPASMHLMVITRFDPPIDFSSLRARGGMVEIRSRNLRFNEEETGKFLQSAIDRKVDKLSVQNLHKRTEGWVQQSASIGKLKLETESHCQLD